MVFVRVQAVPSGTRSRRTEQPEAIVVTQHLRADTRDVTVADPQPHVVEGKGPPFDEVMARAREGR
jgi:hypothetical protein